MQQSIHPSGLIYISNRNVAVLVMMGGGIFQREADSNKTNQVTQSRYERHSHFLLDKQNPARHEMR